MAADIAQVMRILRYRGISVRVRDGRLIARPVHGKADALVFNGQWYRAEPESGPLPDDMVRFIQRFKNLIIAELDTKERTAA